VELVKEKRAAAEAAAELVENGMTVGLGTGSTEHELLPVLARRNLSIRCVATSPRTESEALADSTKPVDMLRGPVPLELLTFCLHATMRRLRIATGCDVVLRDFPASPDGGVIADLQGPLNDPLALATLLGEMPGLVEHGLFPPKLVALAFVGRGDVAELLDFAD